MNASVGQFVIGYLLFPLIVLILGLLSVVIAKKNKLLSDKKAVITVLASSLIYSLFGLTGFFGITFMPYGFLTLQLIFLLIGYVNYKLLLHNIEQLKSVNPIFVMLVIVLQFILSWAVFSIIFNLTNELQYGFWAGTSLLTLLFYPVFEFAYHSYIAIPAEIRKIQVYNATDQFEPYNLKDDKNVIVVEVHFPQYIGDEKGKDIRVGAKDFHVLGEWFGKTIVDYNTSHLEAQVELYNHDVSYGWIFYTERSIFKSRRYLDPDLTFESNGLSRSCKVIARRVKDVKI